MIKDGATSFECVQFDIRIALNQLIGCNDIINGFYFTRSGRYFYLLVISLQRRMQ